MNLSSASSMSCQKSCLAFCISFLASKIIIHRIHLHRLCDQWTKTYHISLTYFNHDVPNFVYVKKIREQGGRYYRSVPAGWRLLPLNYSSRRCVRILSPAVDKAIKEIGKNVTGVQGDTGNLAPNIIAKSPSKH